MNSDEIKRNIKIIIKKTARSLWMFALPIILIIILICVSSYFLTVDDGVFEKNDMTNAPYAVSTYTENINVDENGQALSSMTAQELWDEMKKNNNRGVKYLDSPEQLLKLMNAELVTQFLDTRQDPDEAIDWEAMNDVESKDVQGVVKLKRADDTGNNYTMTYVDSETFQNYIDKYNSTGAENDKKEALKHFTLESITESSYDNTTATVIKKGDVINIPQGLGSVHTYMGWQKITSTTSTQYKLRQQAGMNFDEEGFGKINGRYVIACTTTYGTVGDYIDFYQEDGTIIPCVIGDIKNQNDSGCTKWGHNNGRCVIEFIVNKDTWYNTNHANPGTSSCHPEWNKNLTKAVNGGSYFDNPNFGTENVAEENEVNEKNDAEAMKWPTDSTQVTSEFGNRTAPTTGASTNHKGIDIGVSEGTNVYACEDGKVTTASFSSTAGNWIVIDHGNGYISKYMHNKELKVSVGDKVEKGQVIALSGNTGNSTGPHLHFQIEYQGNPIDPMSLKYDNGQGNGTKGIGSNEDNKDGSNVKYYAKVATWDEHTNKVESTDPDVSNSEETTYSMTTKNINYKDFLNSYTMPFEYLWAFLVISENKDMVLELADLVYNSEIEITVHDNLTVTKDVVEDKYTKKKKTDTTASVTVNYGESESNYSSVSNNGEWTDEESNEYKVVQTTINKSNTLDISLTKANVWIVNYTQEYTYSSPTTTTTTNEENFDDVDYPDNPDSTSENDTYQHAQILLSTLKNNYIPYYYYVSGQVDSVSEKIYNATVDKSKKTTNTIEKEEYTSSPGNVEEKTDPGSDEDNFVTILRKKKYSNAKNTIFDVSSWLLEILENNDSTKDMIDLTKYLLNKVKGTNYYKGVEQYDFSEYEPSSYDDYSSSYNDYIVKTNDSGAAPVVDDKEKFKKGLKKWLKKSSSQKENALSVLDTVLECQEENHVNAVFTYAFLRAETGIGTANTNYVNNDNNWGSWNLGTRYSSPEENIKTITEKMENGNIYFSKGNNSVSKIGAIYCPNDASHPSQGDNWIKTVTDYMTDLYSCMDVETGGSVATGGAGTIGVYNSTKNKSYNLYLQGSGAPWANEDYGDSHSMAAAGCGPTATAIIASAYDSKITPSTVRKETVKLYGLGNHSSATFMKKVLKNLLPNVKTEVANFDENKIKKCLNNSGQVWFVVQHCKYTSGAHCMALIDYKDSGMVYVAHGTAKSRPYGWNSLSEIKGYIKYSQVLYVGGK